ncbi:hypothetical protein HKX48_004323 [Thoreauomyces humboldtii]|nr:hypothetical protein HKX48_004323 [Thoreauomyces humboldtii]
MSAPQIDPEPLGFHDTITIDGAEREVKAPTLQGRDDHQVALPTTKPTGSSPPPAPDGGYGWIVVLSSFCFNFIVYGTNNIWGVYQSNLFQQGTIRGATMFQLSFVGGLGLGLIFTMGPIVTWSQAKFGTRPPLFFGTLLMCAGIEVASVSTELWHLFISLSIMYGIGAGFLFSGSVAVPSQWFNRKRALATGLASSGSGVGGAFLAPIA